VSVFGWFLWSQALLFYWKWLQKGPKKPHFGNHFWFLALIHHFLGFLNYFLTIVFMLHIILLLLAYFIQFGPILITEKSQKRVEKNPEKSPFHIFCTFSLWIWFYGAGHGWKIHMWSKCQWLASLSVRMQAFSLANYPRKASKIPTFGTILDFWQ